MLRTGDFAQMLPQFEYFRRGLPGAVERSKIYWGVKGASFQEQLEPCGLPCGNMWGWDRMGQGFGDGHTTTDHMRYHYQSQVEVALMMLDYERFSGADISPYIEFMDQATLFFDSFYRLEARKRTGRELDEVGHLILYPAQGLETYLNTTNPADVTTGLRVVLSRLLELDEKYAGKARRAEWQARLGRIPPIPLREHAGQKTIAPAKAYRGQLNNMELPQLYPVFPYRVFGVGKPGLQTAIDTWAWGVDTEPQRQIYCWFQGPIFAAMLGLTEESRDMVTRKMADDTKHRFPATGYGRGFDWAPDMDHGGSGMIALQEMVIQTDGMSIAILPTWPADWPVEFKQNAPYQTVVEGRYANGAIRDLRITVNSNQRDCVELMLWRTDGVRVRDAKGIDVPVKAVNARTIRFNVKAGNTYIVERVEAHPVPAPSRIHEIRRGSMDEMKIAWTPVKNAISYTITRKDKLGRESKIPGVRLGVAFTDHEAPFEEGPYTYRVSGLNESGTGTTSLAVQEAALTPAMLAKCQRERASAEPKPFAGLKLSNGSNSFDTAQPGAWWKWQNEDRLTGA